MTLAESQTEKLGSLFTQGLRFEVPAYQRKYSWEKKHAKALWDDISDSYTNGNGGMDHFLGTISLLEKEEKGIKTHETYEIIDGQQRITTLYLLLKVLFEKLGEDKHRNAMSSIVGDEDSPRLMLSGEDKEWLLEFLFKPPKDSKLEKRSQKRIKEVCDYFRSVAKPYSAPEIERIIKFMQDHLTFLIFKVDDQGKAIKMFSSINDRGLPLKVLDKVKSILMLYDHLYLKGILSKNINDRFESIFTAYDKLLSIADSLGTSGRGRGLLNNLNEDTVFSHHYISARKIFPKGWGYRNSVETIFEQIKRQCGEKQSQHDELEEFIGNYIIDFDNFVNSYYHFIANINENEIYRERFEYLEMSAVLFPLIIRLYMADKLEELMPALETIEVRVYRIREAKSVADIYKLSSRLLEEPDLSTEDIRNLLKDFCEGHVSEHYFKRLLNDPIADQTVIKYLVYSYNQQQTRQNLNFDAYKELDKEHIFSKLPNFDVTQYGFDEETFEDDKHKIGNILLLEKRLNRSPDEAGNKAPSDKADSYLKSRFEDTKKLGGIINKEKNKFNKEDVDKRGEDIINFCIEKYRIN